ncbi:MAG: hypothetical protein H8D22_10170 [Candidatus Cloacimonetes bacterium]|nr:hypothetical protein [Candidatus Cloacimonadota bacterium]
MEELIKVKDWINKNQLFAVEIYFERKFKLDIAQIWHSTSEMGKKLYDEFIEIIYDKYSDDIFDYLSEHPKEMR